MATQMKIETTVNIVDSLTPSTAIKILSNVDTINCASREYGLQNMPANTLNVQVANNVQYINIISPLNINIEVKEHSTGNSIATFTSKNFTYQNKDTSIDVTISNTNATTIDVEYITATIAD